MNLLARLVAPSSTKQRLCYLRPISALYHCSSYSTKATSTVQKKQKSAKPGTQKSSETTFSFARTIKKQAEPPPAAATLWPKPLPIPYQPKAANFVNLIGNVAIPVKFETDSEGRHFSVTVISLGNEGSLSIPVMFEGDLAHVVACHVKENDCIFVSGQLSDDPLLSQSLGRFHVVAENVNFVVGFDRKIGVSSTLGIDEFVKHGNKAASGVEFDSAEGKRVSSIERPSIPLFEAKTEPKSMAVDGGNAVSSAENVGNKSWESGSKKRDANQTSELWRNLVKNPLQWWDYRSHKAAGIVKEKFPDFKQKVTGESLWISSAPKWILPGLQQLQFDVKEMKPMVVGGRGERKQSPYVEDSVKNLVEKGHSERKQNPDLESSWKNLVENPQKWWDNRTKKMSSKSPDFRHKETGECLWLNRSPEWALSKLPPVKGGQNTAQDRNILKS